MSRMKYSAALLRCSILVGLLLFLSACAGYTGYTLKPGVATLPEIIATMGEPEMRWDDPDGRVQLAYPRGPAGTQTFMVHVAPDGRLERIVEVLRSEHFARIISGQSDQAAVLRILGPSQPHWTAYFKARDELVWEWRFCDGWGQLARFDVLFDATTGIVRTTYQRPDLMGRDGVAPACSH